MVQPKYKVRSGNIQASVFENKGKDKQGKEFSYETIQLQRSYKDKSDNWVNENLSLRKQDIIKLLVVLDFLKAKLFLGLKEAEESN
jgi:hypothetical protein